jgi:hypothetical protein
MLRQVPGVTAYYEPCHDGLLEHLRAHTRSDPTHVGVSDYWNEYVPIMGEIAQYHRRDFATQRLCLSDNEEHPALECYLEYLLSSAPQGSFAALKMNRMDLRLPWLRSRFPGIPIVYVHRDPRDQWVSIVRDQPASEIDSPGLNSGYDLVVWSANLAPYVPLLASGQLASSYQRHYLIWKLCGEFGQRYADCTISFDHELQQAPDAGIGKLLDLIGAGPELIPRLRELLVERKGGAWRQYHDDGWFEDIETRCDRYLEESGILESLRSGRLFGETPPAAQCDWGEMLDGLIYPLCGEISRCRSVLVENLSGMRTALDHAHAYTGQLEQELKKLEQESKKALDARDSEIEKVRRDSEGEIGRRAATISEQARFLESLEAEIAKLKEDSEQEIARRETTISEQRRFNESLEKSISAKQGYISSLEQENAKLIRESAEQISALDAALGEAKTYSASLEDELKKVIGDARREIQARDAMLKEKDAYISSLEGALGRGRGK